MGQLSTVLSAAVGAAVVVLGVFRLAPAKIGGAFIDHIFSRRLEAFRHAQNREIESLRSQLAHVADRGVRSNELEYEAATALWGSFVEAYRATTLCVMGYVEYYDLSRDTDEGVKRFLESTELTEVQRADVLSAPDKTRAYTQAVKWLQIWQARRAIAQLNLLLQKESLFLPDSLIELFRQFIDLLLFAQIQQSRESIRGAPPEPDRVDELLRLGPERFDGLRNAMKARIFHQQA